MDSRRDALKKMAAVVAAGSAAAAATPALASPPRLHVPEDSPEESTQHRSGPWPLLAPYTAGDRVGGWTLAHLGPVVNGAALLELARDDLRARVHLCANGGHPCGLSSTDRFDLVLMNFGDGNTDSPEDLARALAVLAASIEANTEAAALACPELTELMPHGERLATWFGEDREVLV
jgi:hypothetical protein